METFSDLVQLYFAFKVYFLATHFYEILIKIQISFVKKNSKCLQNNISNHWGQVVKICSAKWVIIGFSNDMSFIQHQSVT